MEANFCRLLVGVSTEPTYLYGNIYLSTSSFIVRDMTVATEIITPLASLQNMGILP